MNLLRNTSFVLAFFILVSFIGLLFEYKGFDLGYETANQEFTQKSDNISDKPLVFGEHGPTKYEWFATKFFYIALLSILILIVKFFDLKMISQIISILLISSILYLLWLVQEEKKLISQTPFWNNSYDALLRNSVSFEWGCFFVALILLIFQLLELYFIFYGTKNTLISTSVKE